MLRNGSYSAWFRPSQGEGTGIVTLNDGKVSGGDTVMTYDGSYLQNEDHFTASIATRRHTQGPPSVFGIDNVDLALAGKSTPTTASCIGTAKQAPAVTFEATLIRGHSAWSQRRQGDPTLADGVPTCPAGGR